MFVLIIVNICEGERGVRRIRVKRGRERGERAKVKGERLDRFKRQVYLLSNKYLDTGLVFSHILRV